MAKNAKKQKSEDTLLTEAKVRFEIAELNYAAKEYERATSILDSIESSVNNEIRDYDLEKGWILQGDIGSFSEDDYRTIQANAFKLYHNNPYARAIVRTLVKFVLGKGPKIVSYEKRESTKKKMMDFFEEFKKENKFNLKEKEIATRLFRDGEFFIRTYINEREGKVKIRFIRPQLIRNPVDKTSLPETTTSGITSNPKDIEDVRYYWKCDSDGNFKEKINADEIVHYKIFSDSDQARGISLLRIAAKRLNQYEGWLNDRIILNKVRSAIALIRKVSSGKGTVKSIRDENLSTRFSENRNKTRTPAPGTIITASKGIEYDMLSPKINAQDVKDDGRAMLLSIAAAVGFPEMVLTSDYANSNYASSLIAQNPFVREIEDWQDYMSSFYLDIWQLVLKSKIKSGELPENINLNCEVIFPPMIQADLDKLAKAFEILYRYRIISRKTWRGKMGLDDSQEKLNIDLEDGEDGGVNPNQIAPGTMNPNGNKPGGGMPPSKFNMPLTPLNQYGRELQEAIRKQDWEKVNSLADKIIELGYEKEEIE